MVFLLMFVPREWKVFVLSVIPARISLGVLSPKVPDRVPTGNNPGIPSKMLTENLPGVSPMII